MLFCVCYALCCVVLISTAKTSRNLEQSNFTLCIFGQNESEHSADNCVFKKQLSFSWGPASQQAIKKQFSFFLRHSRSDLDEWSLIIKLFFSSISNFLALLAPLMSSSSRCEEWWKKVASIFPHHRWKLSHDSIRLMWINQTRTSDERKSERLDFYSKAWLVVDREEKIARKRLISRQVVINPQFYFLTLCTKPHTAVRSVQCLDIIAGHIKLHLLNADGAEISHIHFSLLVRWLVRIIFCPLNFSVLLPSLNSRLESDLKSIFIDNHRQQSGRCCCCCICGRTGDWRWLLAASMDDDNFSLLSPAVKLLVFFFYAEIELRTE